MRPTTRILLTGAGGHVGGALLRALVGSGRAAVRAGFRRPTDLPGWAGGIEALVGDLADGSVRDAMLDDAAVVVHLATRGYSSLRPPTPAQLEDDVAATVGLATDAARRGVRRFVFVSSVQVYGDALVGSVDERTPPRPDSAYGESRLAIERALAATGGDGRMEVVVVRLSNAFGVPVFDRPESSHLLVPDLCRQVAESGRIRLRSNGRQYRNVIALRDAVDVLRAVAERDEPVDGTLLLAGPETLTVGGIAEMVATEAEALFGRRPTVEADESDMRSHERFRLDLTRLRSLGLSTDDRRADEIRDLLRHAGAGRAGRGG